MADTTGSDAKMKEPGGQPLPLPTNIRELLWEDKTRTLRELLSSYRLPLAVKLKGGDLDKYCPSVTDQGANSGTMPLNATNNISGVSPIPPVPVTFTVGQDALLSPGAPAGVADGGTPTDTIAAAPTSPDSCVGKAQIGETILQIHETRKRKIILARRMTWEKRQNDYVVTGEQVEIPASLKGWLEVVPDDGRPVEYFDTIGGITSVKCKRFLLRTNAVCHLLTPEENGNSCWIPFEVKPGEVLTTGIVYTDSKRSKNSPQRNIFKRLLKQNKVKKDQELKYLQCFDSLGREIMVPFIVNGVFSPCGDSSLANYDAVYEMQDLILAFGFPVNVQVVHNGNNKGNVQWPKGVLRLYGAREEEFAMVSRVGPDGALSLATDTARSDRFEIPVDKDLLFSRGVIKKKPAIKPKLGANLTTTSLEKQTFKLGAKENTEDKQANVQSKNLKPVLAKSNSASSYIAPLKPSSSNTPLKTISSSATKNNEAAVDVNEIKTDVTTSEKMVIPDTADETKLSSKVGVTSEIAEAMSKDVELPERIPKELKKSRSAGILDKLSVRKVKKERAKLKELRGDDVFSKRIARSELSYQEFFNGLDDEGMPVKSSEDAKAKQDDSGLGSSNGTYKSSASSSSVYGYTNKGENTGSEAKSDSSSSVQTQASRKVNMKDRDLPPIPPDSPTRSDLSPPGTDLSGSKESLYEHLPPAPHPPQFHRSKSTDSPRLRRKYVDEDDDADFDDIEDDEDDGYMIPVKTSEQRYVKKSEFQLRNRPSTPHESYRGERDRKSKSELFQVGGHQSHDRDDVDIDGLFDFTDEEYGEARRAGAVVGGMSAARSTSQLYAVVQASRWKAELAGNMSSLEQRFMENLDLETRNQRHRMNRRHDQARQVNSNPNATIRSHNLKKLRPAARDLFKSEISVHTAGTYDLHPAARDALIQKSLQAPYDHQIDLYSRASRPVLYNGRAPVPAYPQQFFQPQQFQSIYGQGGAGGQYAESEPCYRPSLRPLSAGGPAETFFKHGGGDDSAISVGSRGDGGFHNDSEYSFNEYVSQDDADGWTPPELIEGMTVQEVSKSLRYIGMKDRVVIRFSNEQIDGSMLCTLNENLLKEGFPELNALEIKKILDFIRGWRPKKS